MILCMKAERCSGFGVRAFNINVFVKTYIIRLPTDGNNLLLAKGIGGTRFIPDKKEEISNR
jgi:hypothetical protein